MNTNWHNLLDELHSQPANSCSLADIVEVGEIPESQFRRAMRGHRVALARAGEMMIIQTRCHEMRAPHGPHARVAASGKPIARAKKYNSCRLLHLTKCGLVSVWADCALAPSFRQDVRAPHGAVPCACKTMNKQAPNYPPVTAQCARLMACKHVLSIEKI